VHNSPILLRYQAQWIHGKSAVKIIEKSRRIGLSYAEAADAVLHAADDQGGNVYYTAFSKDMTQGFIQDCATWAKAYNMACGEIEEESAIVEEKEILIYKIRFASGKTIEALSSSPRNLRSKGRPKDRLIIDEAAFIDDLEELLKAAMAMTMWGGEVHIISTHNGDDNPFNQLIHAVRAGRYDYALHRVTLDDALDDGYFKKICEVTGQTWTAKAEADWRATIIKRYRPNEDEELFCIPSMGGGAYLSRALIEACMVAAPVVQFKGSASFNMAPEPVRRAEMKDWIKDNITPLLPRLNRTRRHVFGMDFARTGDMSDIVAMEIGATLHRTVPFVVEMHNVPHKQQEQVLFAIADALPRLSGAAIDAGGNGSYIAESARDRYGNLVDEVHFTENWYREAMPKYKAAFEDHEISIPKHDDILEDHRAIKMVNGVPRVPKGKTDNSGERHGDSAIATLLAYNKSFNTALPMAYQGVARSQDDVNPMRPNHTDDFRSEGKFGGGAW